MFLSIIISIGTVIVVTFLIERRNRKIKNAEHLITQANPQFTSNPTREPTHNEQKVLWDNLTHFTIIPSMSGKSNNILFIFFLIVIMIYLILFIIGIINIVALSFIVPFFSYFIIKSFFKTKYYLDLRSPIFETTGSLLITMQDDGDLRYQVRDIYLGDYIEDQHKNALTEAGEGSLVKIEYSPHSKVVWSVEIVDSSKKQ